MNQKIAVSVVYVAAMFMAIMDTTIVNVALPTIARDFHVSTASVASTVIAFLVSLAVFIPASSWLGDRIGARRVLLGAIIIFTVASALCGQASSLSELVGFRVLQGVGGGLMTPVGLAMLFRVFPPAERVRASAILVIPTALAPALGPVIGGLFVTDLSWRWVFYVNVPIGAIAVIFGCLFLADQRAAERRSLRPPRVFALRARIWVSHVRRVGGPEHRLAHRAGSGLHRGRDRGACRHGDHRTAHERTAPRPTALFRSALSLDEHGHDLGFRGLPRCALPAGPLLPRRVGAERLARRAQHLSRGVRRDDRRPASHPLRVSGARPSSGHGGWPGDHRRE